MLCNKLKNSSMLISMRQCLHSLYNIYKRMDFQRLILFMLHLMYSLSCVVVYALKDIFIFQLYPSLIHSTLITCSLICQIHLTYCTSTVYLWRRYVYIHFSKYFSNFFDLLLNGRKKIINSWYNLILLSNKGWEK